MKTPERFDGPTLSRPERVSAARKQAGDACEQLTRLAVTCERLELWSAPGPAEPIDRRALREAQRCARDASRLALRAAQQLERVQW